jgi:hypothetical protein
MTTQLLNRSLLATLIGATLALGSAGNSNARQPDANARNQEARTAQAEDGDEEQQRKARKAQREAAQAEQRDARQAQARADANARVHNERALQEREQMQARVEAARAERDQARNRAQNQRANERAVAEARAEAQRDRQREQAAAEARARAQADRNARVTPRPSDRAIERSPTHRDIAPQPGVPYGQIVSEQRHRRNAERQEDRNRRDSTRDVRDQREAIAREQARERAYRDYLEDRQRLSRQRAIDLQRANRMAQYRYQQQYYDRLRQVRLRDSRYDWYSDPYFNARPQYGYYRAGNYYQVNRYAADMLRDAVRMGYQEGVHAGRADRMDGWRPSYRDSFAYQDANYGYRGYYVDRQEYAHYFREGFRRGYEDGYYGSQRYGRYDRGHGNYSMLGTVLSLILNFRDL